LERDELNEIAKSVETIKQLQELQTQLLRTAVSDLFLAAHKHIKALN